MKSIRGTIDSILQRKITGSVEKSIEEARDSNPFIAQDEELNQLLQSPIRETGDLSNWARGHPSIEYGLWVSHVTRNVDSPEEAEEVIRRKAHRRLRSAERTPAMLRARTSLLGVMGALGVGACTYAAIENVSQGKYIGAAIVSALGILGTKGMIVESIQAWNSSEYMDVAASVHREQMYYQSIIANLDTATLNYLAQHKLVGFGFSFLC